MAKKTTTSPLRYPGGKVKLFDYVSELITDNFSAPPRYCEPFAGGASLAVKLLLKGKVSDIHINDLDRAIWSVWNAILNHTDELITLIRNTPVTVEVWRQKKSVYTNQSSYDDITLGFATLFLNRTNRSGIMLAGPIGGLKQDGNYLIDCRFNKDNLIELIRMIASKREHIHLTMMDASDFVFEIDSLYNNVLIYLDPPYVQKGPILYKNSFLLEDHINLSEAVFELRNKWFMTYDPHELVKKLYIDYDQEIFHLNYSVDKSRVGEEIAIFSHNLSHSKHITI